MKALSHPLLVTAVVALVSACGASTSSPTAMSSAVPAPPTVPAASAAGPSVTIGLLVPFTESAVNSDRGVAQRRAAELYVQQHGGMLGGQTAAFAYEDESINGPLDVTKAQELAQQHAAVVLGLLGDDGATAVRSYADANKLPLIITGASGNAVTRTAASPYVFRASYSNWQLSEPLGEWAARKGATKFYVVHAPDTFGTESAAGFAAGLGKAGGSATGNVASQMGADWAKLVAAIRAQPTKAVFAAFEGADAAAFLTAWSQAKMDAAGYTLYGPGTLTDSAVLATVKEGAAGAITSLFWADSLGGAGLQSLLGAFPKAYQDDAGNPAPVTSDVVAMWDAMQAVDQAMASAGSSADALVKAVAAGTVAGVRGPFAFDPATHNVVQAMYIRKVVVSGGSASNSIVDTVPSVADPGH